MSNNICIISGGDEVRLRSYINHSIYAREHGFDYRLECGVDPAATTKFGYKMSIIRRLLALYDWIVWIDDDAYFTDFVDDPIHEYIEEAEQSGCFIVIANGPLEPNGFWSNINTGVVALKNCEESFEMLRLAEVDLMEVRKWWVDDRDGLFTNGDQDQIWWALNQDDLLEHTLIVDHLRWNSRGHYYQDSLSDAFVMHFTGYPDKSWGVVRFAMRFGVGQELVPAELLDKYRVRKRDPMSKIEYQARSARVRALIEVKAVARRLGMFETLRNMRNRVRDARSPI
ncbi:MAG: hypothetical protein LKI24_11955 [Acidipropionibacterium sp.]|jgi:hypothetical protein|nr:hypothetical protein [Acidipropionibacterium sp.]